MSAASFSAFNSATSEVSSITPAEIKDCFSYSLPLEVKGVGRFEDEIIAPASGVGGDTIQFYVPASSAASGGFVALGESYVRLRLAIKYYDRLGAVTNSLAIQQGVVPEADFMSQLFTRVSTIIAGVELGNDTGGLEMYASHIYKCLTKTHNAAGSTCISTTMSGESATGNQTVATTASVPNYGAVMSEKEGWSTVFCIPGYGGNNGRTGVGGLGAAGSGGGFSTGDQIAGWMRLHISQSSSEAGGALITPYVELLYQPQGGIWSTGKYDSCGRLMPYALPPNVDMQFAFTKGHVDAPWVSHTNASQIASIQQYAAVRAAIDWSASSAELVLRRYFPSAMLASRLAASAFSSATLYPFNRMRVFSQTYAYGTSSITLAPLLPGPKGSVMVVAVIDANSVSKPVDSDGAGGQNYRGMLMSGASIDYISNSAEVLSGTVPSLDASTRSYCGRITSAQLAFNSRMMPRRPLVMPSEMDSARCYELYRRCCVNPGCPALTEAQWKYNSSLICFDLTDSSSADSAMRGETTEAPSADSGSFTLDLQLVPNQHNSGARVGPHGTEGRAKDKHPIQVICCLIGTAYASISASTGSVSRFGL